MSARPSPTHAFCSTALAVALLAAPAAAQERSGREPSPDERRIVVDISSPGSQIWRLRRGGYLGIHMVELTPELRAHFGVDPSAGVMVGSVAEDSPAAEAGLAVGDIVVSIDGAPIESRRSLARRIAARDEGDAVALEVFRDGTRLTLEAHVDLRQRPQLWLGSVGDSGHHTWQSDGGVTVLPAPGSESLSIETERFERVLGDLHERLESADFDASMFEFRSNTEELEERIRELEERLQKLSEQLEKLEE